jgi:hypothetical protein
MENGMRKHRAICCLWNLVIFPEIENKPNYRYRENFQLIDQHLENVRG